MIPKNSEIRTPRAIIVTPVFPGCFNWAYPRPLFHQPVYGFVIGYTTAGRGQAAPGFRTHYRGHQALRILHAGGSVNKK